MPAQTPGWKLAVRAVFRALTFLLPFACAGRLDWWRGWLFTGSLLLIAGVSFAVLRRKNPDLMRRRMEPQPGVQRFDRFVLAVTAVCFLGFFAVAGLDARYGWSQLSAAWIWPGARHEAWIGAQQRQRRRQRGRGRGRGGAGAGGRRRRRAGGGGGGGGEEGRGGRAGGEGGERREEEEEEEEEEEAEAGGGGGRAAARRPGRPARRRRRAA